VIVRHRFPLEYLQSEDAYLYLALLPGVLGIKPLTLVDSSTECRRPPQGALSLAVTWRIASIRGSSIQADVSASE